MAFNVSQIRSQGLRYGGARQNLFQVDFSSPFNGSIGLQVPLLVTASAIPSADLGTIPVPFFGRTIKLAGDREYPAWNVTIMNDEDFAIRDALEDWSNKINGFQTNTRDAAAGPSSYAYVMDATVTQFDKGGAPVREYVFQNIFPASISEIGLSWAENNSIETYQVQFQYDLWTLGTSITGNAGGDGGFGGGFGG